MKGRTTNYIRHYKDKTFLLDVCAAVLLLSLSLVVNFYASRYATRNASNPVTDIILSNIPIFDVDGIFIYGSIALGLFITFLCLKTPNKLPFTVKSMALFYLVRSLFITLTHLRVFPTHVVIDSTVFGVFNFDGDLFFSGHTGLPFLMALIFWENKYLRAFFIASSLIFGAVVLLLHLHYSIDVLSAFFITYSIFHIAEILFKKDKKIFSDGLD